MRRKVRAFYENEFLRAYDAQKGQWGAASQVPNVEQMVQALSDTAVYLQYWYICQNPHEIGKKSQLDQAADQSAYSVAHGKYHPAIRSFRNRYEFDDIFLVDAESGVVVYTTSKEIDFGTSLKDGPFALTNLGRAFQQAAAASWQGFYAFADFEHFIPSYGDPASFIAAPIFDQDKKIGVAIVQVPIDRIDALCAEYAGLGETGDANLVGPDKLFRTNARQRGASSTRPRRFSTRRCEWTRLPRAPR